MSILIARNKIETSKAMLHATELCLSGIPRLRECCRQLKADVVSKSR